MAIQTAYTITNSPIIPGYSFQPPNFLTLMIRCETLTDPLIQVIINHRQIQPVLAIPPTGIRS